MVNSIGSAPSEAQVSYTLPPGTAPLPLQAPPRAPDPVEEVKVQAEPGLIQRFWSWFTHLFSPTQEGALTEAPLLNPKSALDQIAGVSRMQAYHRDLFEDEVNLSELGIEKKALELRLNQIGIRHQQSTLNSEQIVKLHELINETKAKIDEALKKQLSAAQYAKIFGKLEAGTSTLLITVSLIAAAVSYATAGGLTPIMAALELSAGIIHGSTMMVNAGFKHKSDLLTAELLGEKEGRKSKIKEAQELSKRNQQSAESVIASRKEAQVVEEHRDQIIKGVLR